jgi:hypothetical protein
MRKGVNLYASGIDVIFSYNFTDIKNIKREI